MNGLIEEKAQKQTTDNWLADDDDDNDNGSNGPSNVIINVQQREPFCLCNNFFVISAHHSFNETAVAGQALHNI